jgi:Fe2+ transport system protein FeoA
MSHEKPTASEMPLAALLPDQEAAIARICGDETVRHRIEEMGLCGGTMLRMIRPQAPQIIAVRGRRLCLRTGPQLEIWVTTTAASTNPSKAP